MTKKNTGMYEDQKLNKCRYMAASFRRRQSFYMSNREETNHMGQSRWTKPFPMRETAEWIGSGVPVFYCCGQTHKEQAPVYQDRSSFSLYMYIGTWRQL